MTVIALGWKDADGKSTPKVFYCGPDMDEALKVVNSAGKTKSIALAHILRGIEDRVVNRIVFDS